MALNGQRRSVGGRQGSRGGRARRAGRGKWSSCDDASANGSPSAARHLSPHLLLIVGRLVTSRGGSYCPTSKRWDERDAHIGHVGTGSRKAGDISRRTPRRRGSIISDVRPGRSLEMSLSKRDMKELEDGRMAIDRQNFERGQVTINNISTLLFAYQLDSTAQRRR